MAKARFAKGLRTGSTKTETYSTLATAKQGRIQIIKDRVYDVKNPQTSAQMLQRVAFATVASAAPYMAELITISQEGITNAEFARQQFIADNVKLLKQYARSMANGGDTEAAFAPKGNKQLIPNSYQVSKGSLSLMEIFKPKVDSTSEKSFSGKELKDVGQCGYVPYDETDGTAYTVAQLWRLMFGIMPGDQLTFPQIYGGYGTELELYGAGGVTIDKTLVTQFVAPRIVFKDEMPADTLLIKNDGSVTSTVLQAFLKTGIDLDASWNVDPFIDYIETDDWADGQMLCQVARSYDEVFAVNDDDPLLAIGCILSRKNTNTGKWQYSTSRLVCLYDAAINASNNFNYFGFKLQNAIDTYRATAKTDSEGNFLQSGGNTDILPESFM